MIRRLDDVSRQVHDQLENGPLTAQERHALATSLGRLLPVVADSLQPSRAREPGGRSLLGGRRDHASPGSEGVRAA